MGGDSSLRVGSLPTLLERHSHYQTAVSAAGNTTVEAILANLTPSEQEMLGDLLARPVDYMHSAAFESEDAPVTIYEKAIAKPDIAWYQPLMDRLTRSSTQTVNSGQIKRLSAAEERVLFHQYNYSKYRVRLIQESLGVTNQTPAARMPAPDELREILAWQRKADELRVQVAESNVGLVIAMARRTRIRDLDFADLVSEGNMALLRSIEKFNVDYGNKFSTYACQSILKAFSRLGVKNSRYRERFPVEFEPELETVRPLDDRRADLERDCAEQLDTIVRENHCGLSEVEISVIRHRFGFGSETAKEGGLTLGQVGQIVGVGKERVRQIQVKALAKIRKELETKFLYREPPTAADNMFNSPDENEEDGPGRPFEDENADREHRVGSLGRRHDSESERGRRHN